MPLFYYKTVDDVITHLWTMLLHCTALTRPLGASFFPLHGRPGVPPLREVGLFELFPLRYGQLVAAVVFFVFRVAFDPVVVQFVSAHQGEQLLPEVGVQGFPFIGLDPAFFLP